MQGTIRSEQFMETALACYGDMLYRFALAQLKCASDAQDTVQGCFIALLKSSAPFNGEEHIRAWLLHVCANRCREQHRSAWNRRVECADDMDAYARAVEDPALLALEQHPVWRALAELPEKMASVVHLHYIEEYPTALIAQVLDIPEATVRTRLHRARRQLRRELERISQEER